MTFETKLTPLQSTFPNVLSWGYVKYCGWKQFVLTNQSLFELSKNSDMFSVNHFLIILQLVTMVPTKTVILLAVCFTIASAVYDSDDGSGYKPPSDSK